jgi:ABC-type transporter Mla subunit MlaD
MFCQRLLGFMSQQEHAALARTLEEFATTMQTAIETLAQNREVALGAARDLRSGESVAVIAAKRDMSAVRERLTTALHNLEVARGKARVEIFNTLQRDGHTIGEIARMWGISRQLASRLMRDDRPATPDECG